MENADLVLPASSFPGSPLEERRRFLVACNGNEAKARSMLQRHLEFRAANLPPPPGTKRLGIELPEWAFQVHGVTSHDGTPIVAVLAGLCEPSAGSPNEFAIATAILVDSLLPRHTAQRITLMIDVDHVEGASNPKPLAGLPYIKAAAALLQSNFPERLQRFIVFPVPPPLRWIWHAAKGFLDAKTSAKAVLLAGRAAHGSSELGSVPRFPTELGKFVPLDAMPLGALYGFTGLRRVGVVVPLDPTTTLASSGSRSVSAPLPELSAHTPPVRFQSLSGAINCDRPDNGEPQPYLPVALRARLILVVGALLVSVAAGWQQGSVALAVVSFLCSCLGRILSFSLSNCSWQGTKLHTHID